MATCPHILSRLAVVTRNNESDWNGLMDVITYKHTYNVRLKDFQVQYWWFLFFLTQTIGCRPVASLDHFVPEHLGSAALVEEIPLGTSKVVKVTNVRALMYVKLLFKGVNKFCIHVCRDNVVLSWFYGWPHHLVEMLSNCLQVGPKRTAPVSSFVFLLCPCLLPITCQDQVNRSIYFSWYLVTA